MGFGRGGVSDHEDVNVTPQVRAVIEVLFESREELQRQGFFDGGVPVDGGGEGGREEGKDVRPLREGTNVRHVRWEKGEVGRIPSEDLDVVDENDRGKDAGGGRLPVGRVGGEGAIDSRDLDAISGFDPIDEVMVEYELDRPWELAHGCLLGHFLQRDRLVVLVLTQTEFGLEGMVVLVDGGVDRGGQLHQSIGNLAPVPVYHGQTEVGVGGVHVGFGRVLVGGGAVVDGGDDFRFDRGDFGRDALDGYELAEGGGVERSWRGGVGVDGARQRDLDGCVCV